VLSGRPKIVFVHIPRTGGMTFGEILRTVYAGSEICSFYGDETHSVANEKIQRFVSLDAAKKNSYAVLNGHVIFDFDKSLEGFHYVTLLRKPLDRLVSYYFYALRQRHHYLHSLLLQRRINLEQFLLSDLSIELDNYQVRAVSGAAFPAVRERVNQDHLELAKQNLRERFVSFGLSESFERSMLEFARVFGWSLPPFGHTNRAEYGGKPDLSVRAREEVARRNQFDLQLYQYAQALFAARIDPQVRSSMAR
jgi:hypothetical protein